MIPFGKFSCPSCGSYGQHFSVVHSHKRVVKKTCDSCGAEIESNMRHGKYILLLIYIHVILALVAVPFVLAMAGEKWGVAIASAAIFMALVWLPAMTLHARNATIHEQDKKGYRNCEE